MYVTLYIDLFSNNNKVVVTAIHSYFFWQNCRIYF